ncbi:TRAP transporter substrate-binding protein [Paenirhodobacter populi]|nr:TRAP transporter substrate-binding protein [Sinirhodobacter populi]
MTCKIAARRLSGLVLGSAMALAVASSAQAETKLKAIGYTSNLYMWGMEKAFFAGEFKDAGAGVISIDAVPHDVASLKGPEVLSMLQDGTLQLASQNISYMAGEDPRFEALDLAGVTLTNADAKKATDAYKPVLAKVMEEKFNTHLLGLAPLPSQVFWCRDKISALSDLKGKKIRIFNSTLADFVEGVGGTSVTIPFVEVIPALQRGVADCAVTGTSSGNTARWFEVTQAVYPMNVGWSMIYWAANKQVWDGLSPEAQKIMTEEYGKLEAAAWAAQIEQDTDALSCLSGGECKMGIPAKIDVVEISEADKEKGREIVRDYVLPGWAKRCGADCVTEWNATVGAALGIEAPLP